MNGFVEAASSQECLKQVLKLSDLVKFAKYKPLQNENDLSIVNSILFVNQTKKEPPKPEVSGEDGQSGSSQEQPERKEKRIKHGMDDKDSEAIDWTIPEDQKLYDSNNRPINR